MKWLPAHCRHGLRCYLTNRCNINCSKGIRSHLILNIHHTMAPKRSFLQTCDPTLSLLKTLWWPLSSSELQGPLWPICSHSFLDTKTFLHTLPASSLWFHVFSSICSLCSLCPGCPSHLHYLCPAVLLTSQGQAKCPPSLCGPSTSYSFLALDTSVSPAVFSQSGNHISLLFNP